jgi:DNA-binding response OmpR family regulator
MPCCTSRTTITTSAWYKRCSSGVPQIELQVATNGRDGIQAAIDSRPRLILLDNRLPDATGSEILSELAMLDRYFPLLDNL